MSDQAFVADLQTILDDWEREGLDGSQVWVTGLRPVADGDYPELEIDFDVRVSPDHMFQGAPRSGTTRVLFGAEWLRASGYDDPASFAPVVAESAITAAAALIERRRAGDDELVDEPVEVIKSLLPGSNDLWRRLEEALGREAAGLTRTSAATVEVIDEDGEPFFVHLTPRDWQAYVVECERLARKDRGSGPHPRGRGLELAIAGLDEARVARRPGEDHLVLFRGSIEPSIREQLPPVRVRATEVPVD